MHKIIEWYEVAFKYCNDIEVLERKIIEDFDEKKYFDLSNSYQSHLADQDFISHDIGDYQKEFNKASTIRTGWTNLTVKTELNPNITQNPN